MISLLFALSLLVSCGQVTNKKDSGTSQEIQPISVSEFISDASPLVDRTVSISGTVVHVCRHGGQRLFIVGEDGEERIRITTGESIAEFDVELEGKTIEVAGIVKELVIDETYLAEWEADVLEGNTHDLGEGHEGGVGHGDSHEADTSHEGEEHDDDPEAHKEKQLARIQQTRDEIAQSGKDHLSDYWIETIEYKVIEE
jgi:hypothetical protein